VPTILFGNLLRHSFFPPGKSLIWLDRQARVKYPDTKLPLNGHTHTSYTLIPGNGIDSLGGEGISIVQSDFNTPIKTARMERTLRAHKCQRVIFRSFRVGGSLDFRRKIPPEPEHGRRGSPVVLRGRVVDGAIVSREDMHDLGVGLMA